MIYIQTPNGLTQISSQLTKEKIIAALGYTPADNASFYEDETGALVIADEKGYIIAKINENGFKTTTVSAQAIKLNDIDLAEKLQELESKEVDLSNFYNKAEVDNKLKNVTIDTSALATKEDVSTHADNTNVHINSADKAKWDAKSNFSGNYSDLSGAPNITSDSNDNELIITDGTGNVIMRVNANGLNVADIYIKGEILKTTGSTFYIRWDTDEQPTPYKFLPGMNFKDWVNSEYCSAPIVYNDSVNYYRHGVAGLSIVENFGNPNSTVTHGTTLYENKIFYGLADGLN